MDRRLLPRRYGVTGMAILAATLWFSAADAQQPDPSLVERGRQVAIAADCSACHTNGMDGVPYAGGYSIMSPVGTIIATNITPSKTDGIGSYSEEQFARAVREGVRADGARLYPAMPYTAYAGMTDDDVRALYAYMMNGIKPADTTVPATQLPFPFSVRQSMIVWNMLFLSRDRFKPDPGQTAEWNRGRYLADILAHCGTCHTPRNFMMAEDTSHLYAGASLGNWYAPNITSDKTSGIGGWSDGEIIEYLSKGRVHGKAQAGGGMAEAVTMSLQHLPKEDLHAIVSYLRTIKPQPDPVQDRPAFSYGEEAHDEDAVRGAAPSNSQTLVQDGKVLYSGYCASCHQSSGSGTPDQGYPSLYHNTATGRANADNLVTAILVGVQRETGEGEVFMPRFDGESYVQSLTDEQIAAISNYVLKTFGNGKVRVTVDRVKELRAGGTPSPIIAYAGLAMPALVAAGLIVLVMCVGLIGRLRRRSNSPSP